MNEPAPLTPDDIDVLLSAELDGDFDDAAGELGRSASEARAQLAALPGIDDRRRALAQARDLIAVPPVLAPADADRLVATALAPDDLAIVRRLQRKRERSWRVLVATGSVAAAIALIVGIASIKPSGDSAKSSAGSVPETASRPQNDKAADAPPLEGAPSLDLGDVTTQAGLRGQALHLLSNLPDDAVANNGSTGGLAASPTAPNPEITSQNTKSSEDSSFSAADIPACAPKALAQYRLPSTPAVVARGTVSGAPVAILIYETAAGHDAYVVRVGDCTLLRRQHLG